LPQESMAVTVKVLVIAQAEPLVTEVTLTVVLVPPQAEVAVTPAFTLATVGSEFEAGLQPRVPPAGTVTVGGVVSAVQE